MFHVFHAYECAISAAIAAHGESVPPNHRQRLVQWSVVRDPSLSYAATEDRLYDVSIKTRNNALYYDAADELLPADRFPAEYVGSQLRLVARFVFQLRHHRR